MTRPAPEAPEDDTLGRRLEQVLVILLCLLFALAAMLLEGAS